jgi:glutamate-1-semialdehyde 2,1-aminomutase
MSTLHSELKTYEARTTKSRAQHERAKQRVPLGVGSNYRYYEPYPMSVSRAQGGRLWDLDGNEYLDHNLCFGALMAGHCHPAVQRAIQERMSKGTLYGMPHELELELAEELCKRFPLDMVRFGSGGADVTMYSVRLARAFTGRDKFIKIEGGYHGGSDTMAVSLKPGAADVGDARRPNQVAAGRGIPKPTIQNTLVAPFNDLDALRAIFEEHGGQIAALITEPILMNLGICMPGEGYLQAAAQLCAEHGALFILDEVKTGAKLAYGGACEYFGLKPDILCAAKSIGGGLPLAIFGGRREIMMAIADGRVFHAGTYNANPLVLAAGLATLREVLTPDVYPRLHTLNRMLVEGYDTLIKKHGLEAYVTGVGTNGALMFSSKPVLNYRDWLAVDAELWKHYWFGMVNRGVLAQPYWWDEQWSLCVAHTEADVAQHLAAFADLAPHLARAQQQARAAGGAR